MADFLRLTACLLTCLLLLAGCAVRGNMMMPAKVDAQNSFSRLTNAVQASRGMCMNPTTQRMTVADYAEARRWRGIDGNEPDYVPPEVRFQQPMAPFPKKELKAGIEGAVRVLLYVSEDGSVTDSRAVCATDDDFIPNALETLRHNQYVPATLGGKPVRDLAYQVVVFSF